MFGSIVIVIIIDVVRNATCDLPPSNLSLFFSFYPIPTALVSDTSEQRIIATTMCIVGVENAKYTLRFRTHDDGFCLWK